MPEIGGDFVIARVTGEFVAASGADDFWDVGVGVEFVEFVAVLGERRIGALPVVDDDGVCGIVSERDLIYCLRDHGAEVLDWPVGRVMTSPAVTVDRTTPVLTALAMMTQQRIRHLPIVEDGQLRGIVSIGDLVKYRMDRIEQEAEAMRTYIQSA